MNIHKIYISIYIKTSSTNAWNSATILAQNPSKKERERGTVYKLSLKLLQDFHH